VVGLVERSLVVSIKARLEAFYSVFRLQRCAHRSPPTFRRAARTTKLPVCSQYRTSPRLDVLLVQKTDHAAAAAAASDDNDDDDDDGVICMRKMYFTQRRLGLTDRLTGQLLMFLSSPDQILHRYRMDVGFYLVFSPSLVFTV